VTGVQTCALPIFAGCPVVEAAGNRATRTVDDVVLATADEGAAGAAVDDVVGTAGDHRAAREHLVAGAAPYHGIRGSHRVHRPAAHHRGAAGHDVLVATANHRTVGGNAVVPPATDNRLIAFQLVLEAAADGGCKALRLVGDAAADGDIGGRQRRRTGAHDPVGLVQRHAIQFDHAAAQQGGTDRTIGHEIAVGDHSHARQIGDHPAACVETGAVLT